MEPQFRFAIDLFGLFFTVLALALALIFVQVVTPRTAFGLLALLFIAAAWACSFWAGLSDSGSGIWPLACVVMMCAATLFLGLSFASVWSA